MAPSEVHNTPPEVSPRREDLRAALEAAVRAPSVHNTQPWRFRLLPDAVEVYGDRARQLPVLDPRGRELTVSCGAAIGCARAALAASGLVTVVVPVAPGSPPVAAVPMADLLATVRVISSSSPTGDEVALADAVERRRSVRSRLSSRRVYDTHVEALVGEATALGVGAVALRDPAVRDDVLVMHARADAVLEADPAYREELARWIRAGGGAVDGLTHPVGDVPERSAREWAQRAFPAGSAAGPARPPAGEPDDPLVLVLSAPDERSGWLAAGEAMARVLLRATVLGFVGVPMTQVVEVPAERERLRRRLRGWGEPQVLLRLGHESSPRLGPPVRRRPVSDVLVPGPEGAPGG